MIKQIAVEKAWELLSSDESTTLIDVRTESEWDSGIPDITSNNKEVKLVTIGSNIELFENKLQDEIPDRQANLIFICRSGARSEIAAQIAKNLGYVNSFNLSGGFLEWLRKDLAYKKWRS